MLGSLSSAPEELPASCTAPSSWGCLLVSGTGSPGLLGGWVGLGVSLGDWVGAGSWLEVAGGEDPEGGSETPGRLGAWLEWLPGP